MLFAKFYNENDISLLAEGTIFGMLTSLKIIKYLLPSIDFSCGRLQNHLDSYDLSQKSINENPEALLFNKDVPLIFKKTNGNKAIELLTGNEFTVTTDIKNVDDLSERGKGAEYFEKNINKYMDNTLIFQCKLDGVFEYKRYNGIFVVNDGFKYIYGKDVLSRKKDVIEAIEGLKEQSKFCFDEGLEKCAIAKECIENTNNIIKVLKKEG